MASETQRRRVAFLGAAFLGIGYTDDVGWTHTNNTIKNADLYELTLTGPDSYLWEGGRARSLIAPTASGSGRPTAAP